MVIEAFVLSRNSDELRCAAETCLKNSLIWLPYSKRQSSKVIVTKSTAKNLGSVAKLLESNPCIQTAMVEIKAARPIDLTRSIIDLEKKVIQNGWFAQYTTLHSNVVGSVFNFKATYLVLGTRPRQPFDNMRAVAAPEKVERYRRFHSMGKAHAAKARKANRLGEFSKPILATFARWESKAGPMPEVLVDPTRAEINPEWFGWAFGHGIRPLDARTATSASVPDLAALGWQTAVGLNPAGHSEPSLFPTVDLLQEKE